MSKKKYEAMLFDIGKVLIPFDFTLAYNMMAARCGVLPEKVRSDLAATGLFQTFESGRIGSHEFAGGVGQLLGFPGNYEEFCAIWTAIFLPDPLLPDSLVAGLRRNHRTLIVSNTNAIHFEMLRKTYPILDHFDEYVLSFQVHAMKPAAEFYEAAVRIAKCPAERCLFIDDLAENVAGARKAGMDAIHFQSRAQLENELATRGLVSEAL
jgi:glucose-1-phosphatase